MRVLYIVQTESELLDSVTFALESRFGAVVETCHTLAEARHHMTGARKATLVLVGLPTVSVQDHETFFAKYGDRCFLVCLPPKDARDWTPSERLALVHEKNLLGEVVVAVERWIKEGALVPSANIDAASEKFCRIRTKVLLSVVPLKGDIYIRLTDDHYVKIFHEGAQFDQQDMERITIKKGVEYLYIQRSQVKEFVDKYCVQLEEPLSKKQLDIGQAVKTNEAVYETVRDMGKHFGFSRDVQILAKSQMQVTMKSMAKAPKLRQFLQRLSEFEGEYLSTHSLATGYLACAISSHLEWGSESTFQKLTMAAFLHDISLDDSELAKIANITELNAAGLSVLKRNDVMNHSARAAEIARGFSEVPPDVDSIIQQHHEQPDGTGFPRGLKHTYISPLASIFGIAHDIAHQTVTQGKAFQVVPFIDGLKQRYPFSNYRKIFAAIDEVFK